MIRHASKPRLPRLIRIGRRRLVRGLARGVERWNRWLPSWGTSVLVHGVALLILALIYFGTGPKEAGFHLNSELAPPSQPIGEAVTTIVAADVAGDPWAKGTSTEFPSLGRGPADSSLKATIVPALPAMAKFGPTLTPPRVAPLTGMKLTDSVSGRFHMEDMTAPFSGRDPEMKAKLLRREGGTVASEMAVQAGLDWIVRHQRADGAWNLDYHSECTDPPCPAENPKGSDTAATGLGLLPLLGAGHIHNKPSRYQENVRRGLEYLVSRQSPEGELFIDGGFNYRFYSHAIATMALCEAYGISKDKGLQGPAQRAIYWIAKNQNTDDGGWRYFPGQAGDTSVIGWQMFALRSGKLAGLEVPKRTVQGCRTYLDLAAGDPKKVTYAYQPGRPPNPVMTAEALLCRQYLGWPNDHPSMIQGAHFIWEDLQMSGDRNIYYWYYATQLLHNLGGKDWIAWNKHIRDGLIGIQVVDSGCDRGSWSPLRPSADRWGQTGGRLYTTSLSILTLEVYYRWLPLYRPVEAESDPKAVKDAKDRETPQARKDVTPRPKARGR